MWLEVEAPGWYCRLAEVFVTGTAPVTNTLVRKPMAFR